MLFAGNIKRHSSFENVKYRIYGNLKVADFIINNAFWIRVCPGMIEKMIGYTLKIYERLLLILIKKVMDKYKKNSLVIKLQNKYLPFIKFCAIGVTNATIYYVVYYILLILGVNYLIACTVGYFFGILNGYIWSSKFVFKKNKSLNSMMNFFMVYISSLFINLGIVYICVDTYNMHKLVAPIIAIGIGTLYNFTLNKIWTFK